MQVLTRQREQAPVQPVLQANIQARVLQAAARVQREHFQARELLPAQHAQPEHIQVRVQAAVQAVQPKQQTAQHALLQPEHVQGVRAGI